MTKSRGISFYISCWARPKTNEGNSPRATKYQRIKGRGGMGSHKHGISGHAGHSPRFKHQTELELRREEKLTKKRQLGLTATTVAEAMQHAKPR